MRILLDTNILLRAFQSSHSDSVGSTAAIRALMQFGADVVIVPQNLYELWVVATRPTEANGFGMSVADAAVLQRMCMQQFRLLRDERGVFDRWSGIVSTMKVVGKKAHDARLVAAMVKHSVVNILTYNIQDFRLFLDIRAIAPSDVLAGRLPPFSI